MSRGFSQVNIYLKSKACDNLEYSHVIIECVGDVIGQHCQAIGYGDALTPLWQ